MVRVIEVPLPKGCQILRRIDRFRVEVSFGRSTEIVHNTNTGRLEGILVPGRRGFCYPLRRPGKTRFRLFAVEVSGGYALIDTSLQEEAFAKCIDLDVFPWAKGCRVVAKRPRVGSSTFDFLLECEGAKVCVETKSAVLMRANRVAMYPDCKTLRGKRHLMDLIALAKSGRKAMLVFVAGVPQAQGFSPNSDVDPEILRLMAEGMDAGVITKAIGLDFDPKEACVRLYAPELPILR